MEQRLPRGGPPVLGQRRHAWPGKRSVEQNMKIQSPRVPAIFVKHFLWNTSMWSKRLSSSGLGSWLSRFLKFAFRLRLDDLWQGNRIALREKHLLLLHQTYWHVLQLSWYCSWLSKNYSSSDSSTHNHPAHSAEAFWLQDELENRIDPFQSHTWRQFQQLTILLNWGWVFCGQVKVIKFEPTASDCGQDPAWIQWHRTQKLFFFNYLWIMMFLLVDICWP